MGEPGQFAGANGINDRGVIAGATDFGELVRAFVWKNGNMRQVSETLPEGFTSSVAFDINNRGQIVGHIRENRVPRKSKHH